MLDLAVWDTQSTDFSLFLLSCQMKSNYFSLNPVQLENRVIIQVNSSPSYGSSRQQLSLFVYVLVSGDRLIFLILETALILLVVSLKKILRAFFIINFQVTLSHLSRSKGFTSGCLYFQAKEAERAAQKNQPLSKAGVREAKSGVGTGQVPLTKTQGMQPPNPGYLWLNFSKVSVFFLSSKKTQSQVQISCLPVARMLAKIPTWMDSLLLAVQQCRPPPRSQPVLMSSRQPSYVKPVDYCVPTSFMNLASQWMNYCRKGSGSLRI